MTQCWHGQELQSYSSGVTLIAVFYHVPARIQVDPGKAFGWLREQWPNIRVLLQQQGWVLIRGLPFTTDVDLAAVRDFLGLTPYRPEEIFSPRQDFDRRIYSPMRWPSNRVLCPYGEQAFCKIFPRIILILCMRPAQSGGQTLIVDTRQILRHLPAELVSRFERCGWTMYRTFRPRFGMSWTDAFGITDQLALTARLAEDSISHSWLPGDVLRTSRVLPAIISHPLTGERCWFNQISFLSEWSLEETERSLLIAAFGQDELPVNTAFGEGTPLSLEAVRSIERTFNDFSEEISWHTGDLLLLDNVLVAHGRRPYEGDRQLRIAMAEPSVRDAVVFN